MKTIYDYFTDVYATELDNYPYLSTKDSLIRELKYHYYVSDLTLSSITTITSVLGKTLQDTINTLYNLKND